MCRLFPTSTPLADRNAEDTRSDILCPCHLQMIFLLAFQLSFNWTFTSALKAQTLIHNCEQPKQGRWGKGWVRFVSGRWLKMRLEATFGRVRCIVRWRAPTFWRHCILWCKWCSPRLKCLVTLMGLFRPLSGSACSSCGCLGGEEVWARCSGSGVAMRGAGLFFTQMVNKAIPLAEKLEKNRNSTRSRQRISKMLPLRRKISAQDNLLTSSQSFVRSCLQRSICMGFASLWPCWQRCACSVSVLIVQSLITLENPFATLRGQPFSFQDAVHGSYLHIVGKQNDLITEAGRIILRVLPGPSDIARCLLVIAFMRSSRFAHWIAQSLERHDEIRRPGPYWKIQRRRKSASSTSILTR